MLPNSSVLKFRKCWLEDILYSKWGLAFFYLNEASVESRRTCGRVIKGLTISLKLLIGGITWIKSSLMIQLRKSMFLMENLDVIN